MSKYYRYELAFCEQPQHVGFLQGLSDIGLSENEHDAIMSRFNLLKIPQLDRPAVFYFTEAGRKQFDLALHTIQMILYRYDWQLIECIIDTTYNFDTSQVLYQDEYQIAFVPEYTERLTPTVTLLNNIPKSNSINYHRVCITRQGYAIVPGNTDEEVMEAAKTLSEHDFDWEPVNEDMIADSLEIIESCGPNGEI